MRIKNTSRNGDATDSLKRKAKISPYIHSRFGDISKGSVVSMNQPELFQDSDYKEEESLLINLTVTGRCYAHCQECVNSALTLGIGNPRNEIDFCQETQPKRDATIIELLSQKHPHQPVTLCFYGGEPFLAVEKMVNVWDILKGTDRNGKYRFLVYTNGELLAEALSRFPEFFRSLWTISVSIDGQEKQHNQVRQGTRLSNIIKNLEAIAPRHQGVRLFWSTLREGQSLFDCFQEFMRLYRKKLVTHFFWHWAEHRNPFSEFAAFADGYGTDLEKIMGICVEYYTEGKILPIIHINELLLYMLSGKKRGHTACGVEVAKNYDIVSGRVFPCADLPLDTSIGQLDKKGELILKDSNLAAYVSYKKELGCFTCGVHAYCGGRCPVQVMAGSWERTLQYCQLMRMHVGIVQEHVSDIVLSLKKHNISLQRIYDHSAFLAKYTDVVP